MLETLHKVSNYVVYGWVSKKLIDSLLKTRGFINKDEKKLPISDNNLIEEMFEKIDIICLDDIVDLYNSYSSKESFEAVNSKMWAIQLSPNEEFVKKF